MKALLRGNVVEKFDSKQLVKDVLNEFDEYLSNLLSLKYNAEEALVRNQELREESFTQVKSDPTLKAVIKSDKNVEYVLDFESKINYIKKYFTEEETIIFNSSIIERELDKIIMEELGKTSHRYYEIKISCYLKVALCLDLIKPKVKASKLRVTQNE